MIVRRSHYEIAFESYLNRRGTPCVPIEDFPQVTRAQTGAKGFDYIVYPPSGPACLVEVKGRKSRAPTADGDCRQKTWVTRADVEGLLAWQEAFGGDFEASLVFAYWIDGASTNPIDPPRRPPPTFTLAGRDYSFWIVPIREYARHQKRLSRSWDTVSIPVAVFRRISRPLKSAWPPAPC
ncbi:MAG: HYExAFE family protein [Phycisphaerae bacterium]